MNIKHKISIKAVAVAGFALFSASAQAELTNGLLNYWPMDGDGNDIASAYPNTASATDDHGTSGSNGGAGAISYSAGNFGDALTLAGDAHLVVPDAGDPGENANDTDRTGSDLTISTWVKVTAFTVGWQGILSHGEQTDYRIARLQSGNNVAYAGGVGDLRGGISINDGEWHHLVAVTTHGVGTQLYVDGVLDKEVSNAATGITQSDNPKDVLWIGGNPDNGREFNGQIDDVAMWDRPLTPAEITEIFNAGGSLNSLLNTDDSDGDGLPDGWETVNGFDPNDSTGVNGADGDPDMDNLSNLTEYNGGVQPTNPNNADTDGDTIRDDYETRTGTFASTTDTGTNPTVKDTDQDGLEDNVEDNGGIFVSETQTGSNPNMADTDLDTMPDQYEVTNDLDPNTDDAADDLDEDTLSNLTEFTNGTHPNDKDSDDDTLEDNVEDNTGTYVSATQTGTDPLNPDTDGDQLLDGYETNNGLQSYVSPTDTGTNPLIQDTDLDGYSDFAEISVGTDPTDIDSFPAASSLPIVDDFEDNNLDLATWKTITDTIAQNKDGTIVGGTVSEEEGNVKLGSRGYLYTATEFDPELVGGLEITGELTFLTTQDVVSILTRSDATPVNVYGEANSGVQFVVSANGDTINITARNGDHFVENFLIDGTINFQANVVYTFTVIDDGEGSLSMVVTDKETPENTISATADLTSDTSSTNYVVIYNRESGRDSDLHQIEIKSHLGSQVLQIQEITYDETTDEFTLIWNSRLGVNYSLFASLDLSDFGNEVDDGIEGGDGTTTYTFAHPAQGSEKLFFRVEALPTE
ncbi:hypothetical protein N9291_01670 [bacterium]|nr:hypothetical protein [bacterium]